MSFWSQLGDAISEFFIGGDSGSGRDAGTYTGTWAGSGEAQGVGGGGGSSISGGATNANALANAISSSPAAYDLSQVYSIPTAAITTAQYANPYTFGGNTFLSDYQLLAKSPAYISDYGIGKVGVDTPYYHYTAPGGTKFTAMDRATYYGLQPTSVEFATPQAQSAYMEGMLAGKYPWQQLVADMPIMPIAVDQPVVKPKVSAEDRATMDAAYQAQQAAAAPAADTSSPTMLPTSKAPAAFGDWQNSLLRGITNIAGNTLVNALSQPSRTGGTGQAPNLMGTTNFLADSQSDTKNRLLFAPLPYKYY